MTIWAIGRNYADHAKELGNTIPQEPLVFIKSEHGICEQEEIALAKNDPHSQIHYELEIAIEVKRQAHNQELTAHRIGFALDLTDRQAQNEAKKKGHPWTQAKSFKNSCPLGPLSPIPAEITLAQLETQLEFQLEREGDALQKGRSQDMIFSFSQLLDDLDQRFPIRCGDLILTGTPAGVGPVTKGQTLKASQINTDNPLLISTQWKFV